MEVVFELRDDETGLDGAHADAPPVRVGGEVERRAGDHARIPVFSPGYPPPPNRWSSAS
jgi:hypothetical protein